MAIYYREKGFNVALTTRGGDKGVDIVAFSDTVNYAIQCKHSKNNVGREGVNEIIGGVRYYELKHNCKFKPVIFTNSFYTLQAEETALLNSVETIDRGILPNFIESTKLSLADIYAMEESREI
ncbi:MAG: restriction endonuclease [Rikenellaceae bacterium]